MFIRENNYKTVWDVVHAHTGLSESEYLNPKPLKDLYFKNLEESIKLFTNSVEKNPAITVVIIGDYDSDGINATHILKEGILLKYPSLKVKTRLPHRFSEGYGMSTKIVDEISEEGEVIIITVDNGIAAFDAIELAKKKGYTVIVTDHHLPPIDENGNKKLPKADIILDPSSDEDSDYRNCCGAAIAYRWVCTLNNVEVITPLLVHAAIATVSDVMTLTKANWLLVKEGLEAMNRRHCSDIMKCLLNEAKLGADIESDDIGFRIGPIFNASGRLFDDGAERVLKTISTKSDNEMLLNRMASKLIEVNDKRKQMVDSTMDIANEMYSVNPIRPIVLNLVGINEGLLGIIAGRLCENYQCPAIVVTYNEEKNVLKGSGRAPKGFHLKHILDSIREYLVAYGGHESAAGLSICCEYFDEFREAFLKACGPMPEEKKDFVYDMYISESIIPFVLEELKKYAPFGEGNEIPKFRMTCDMTGGEYRRIGNGTHFMYKKPNITYMGFGLSERYEADGYPQTLDAIVRIKENFFNGAKSFKVEIVEYQL